MQDKRGIKYETHGFYGSQKIAALIAAAFISVTGGIFEKEEPEIDRPAENTVAAYDGDVADYSGKGLKNFLVF